MNESWMQMVGDVILPMFLAGVGAGLIGLVVRAIMEMSWPEACSPVSASSVGRLRRWFCEYVGNATLADLQTRGEERRRNWQVRRVVEIVQHEISKREIPVLETEQILENVREAIRRGGEEPSG